jgi:SNF family Na+-dependent transporter
MSRHEFLHWLQETAVARWVSTSNHLVGAGLQVVHIFGFLMLMTAVLLISLRLLGLVLRQQPVTLVSREAGKFIWVGLALAVLSGILMFLTTPQRYVDNHAFVLKMALLVVAVLLQSLLFQRVARNDSASVVLARSTAIVTLAAWLAIAGAGRFIGFL